MEFVETTTADNLILQGLIAEPEEKGDTIVINMHGMAGNFWENEFVQEMLKGYPKNKLAFLTVENRGSEVIRWFNTPDKKSRRIGNAYEVFEECVHDIDAWIEFARSRGYTKIHLQGYGLGCSKIAYYQKTSPNASVKSLIFLSPSDMMGLLMHEDYKGEYEKHYNEAKALIAKGAGDAFTTGLQWGFYMQSAKAFINFSFDNRNLAIFNYHNPERGFKTIEALKVPIMAISGTKDTAFATEQKSSLRLLGEKAVNSPKFEMEVFDGAAHSFKGFEKQIVSKVLEFLL